MEHGVVMHDYEYSDDDDNATPPPMERASVNLNHLTDVRAHEEIATPRVRTVVGKVNRSSSNIHSL